MIKHIVFDVDGTLLDTRHILEEALRIALDEVMGVGNYPDDLAEVFSHSSEGALEHLGCPDVPRTMALWVQKLVEIGKSGDLFPGMREVIEHLHAEGYTLGIVTNRQRHEFNLDFGDSELLDYFTATVCFSDVANAKPAADPMLKYYELADAKAEEVVFIGDSSADMGCAKASGCIGVVAGWGVIPGYEPEGDYHLEKPADVIDLVNELNARR